MHHLIELPAWERMAKRIVFAQLGNLKGQKILDFGSGMGVTASRFAAQNDVTAVEPSPEMRDAAWRDSPYRLIAGDVSALAAFPSGTFDWVFCHNVLEYIDDKAQVFSELARVLKPGGTLSLLKHNRPGRVMQMAVLLDDLNRAGDLLDGKNSASKFGDIRYYEDTDPAAWCPSLRLERTYGLRTFWDLQQKQEGHGTEEWQEKMIAMETRVSELEPYRSIAFFHHLILKKQPDAEGTK